MNVRQTNFALQITTGVLVMLAVGSIVIGLIAPLDLEMISAPIQSAAPVLSHPSKLPAINSFAPLFSRSLQTSPGTPAMAAETPVAASMQAAVPMAQLVLVGTIGNSVALIKGPDGTVAMVEAGDDVNGAPVIAIRPSQVDLRINGKITTLQKSPPPDDSSVIVGK